MTRKAGKWKQKSRRDCKARQERTAKAENKRNQDDDNVCVDNEPRIRNREEQNG